MNDEKPQYTKPIFYRPNVEIKGLLEKLVKPHDKGQFQRTLDRLICDRYEAEFGKEAPAK